MSKQLNPHPNQDFICDSCRKEFKNQTAYSPTADSLYLAKTYCVNCVDFSKEKTCSFNEIDDKIKARVLCEKLLFDKKKELCRSHNHQVRKRFNEFTKDMSVSSTAAWEMSWEQSGDWRYFWNLAGDEKKESKETVPTENKSDDWSKIKKKSLGEVPQTASQNLQAPETAPSDQRISGRTKQLNLKVKEQTYWQLKELALKEKCLMTEILERALEKYKQSEAQ